MNSSGNDFATLLDQARRGDNAAMGQLVQQYESEVRLVARVLLGPALRPYLDSIDLMQSVHRSLMIGLRDDKFDISKPQNLIALAMTMVRRKVARHWRRVQRQQRLSFGPTDSANLPHALASLSNHQPEPEQTVEFNEAVQKLWSHLDATERQVIELRLQGYSTAEVARELGLDADVLRVKLSRLRQRLRDNGVLTEWL